MSLFIRSTLFVAVLGLAQAVPAQTAAPQAGASAPAVPRAPASFFITSEGLGQGADLGGLAGADAHCQKLAAATTGAAKTWRAYLSTQATADKPAVNARDRIGSGPWYNTRGAVVARDLAHLHGDTVDAARIGNNLSWATAFNEKNEPVKRAGEKPNEHDILTGSQPDGRAFSGRATDSSADRTCRNFTSSGEGAAQIGHFDRTGGGNTSWNSAHATRGCSQANLVSTGGAGLFYCFAVD